MEMWDIYDSKKQRTGRTMKRNDWCLKDGEYHLTVLGVVMRPDGRFLITKRVMTKAWAPGWWEVSGGAVMAGESSKEAVIREVKEETGLDVSGCGDGYLFTYHRENPGELSLQEEETAGYMLADRSQIEEFASQGIFLHYDSIKQAFSVEEK